MQSAAADAGAAVDTSPFFLAADRTGCLLIHGFSGTPYEMRFLGERLYARGHTVCGVLVAGHCTSIEDFERRTWHDWYASVCDGLATLQPRAPRVVAVGQSMGALLALQLAVDYPAAVIGVALLAPALRLSNRWVHRLGPTLLLLPLLGRWTRYFTKTGSDIADDQARALNPGYRQIPARALHQLLRLQTHTRELLPHVKQPALVIHSRQDHTCPVGNVATLQRALPGDVRAVLLDDSYHVISIDVDKERVAAEVAAFVEALEVEETTRA